MKHRKDLDTFIGNTEHSRPEFVSTPKSRRRADRIIRVMRANNISAEEAQTIVDQKTIYSTNIGK